jgi:hypothetical protein
MIIKENPTGEYLVKSWEMLYKKFPHGSDYIGEYIHADQIRYKNTWEHFYDQGLLIKVRNGFLNDFPYEECNNHFLIGEAYKESLN